MAPYKCLIRIVFKIHSVTRLTGSTNVTLPLIWDFAEVHSTRFQDIYNTETIKSKFSSRYKVNTTTKGRFALVIDSVDTDRAGTYRCRNRLLKVTAHRIEMHQLNSLL